MSPNPVIRWRVDEQTGDKRVVYFYARVWDNVCDKIICAHLGHKDYKLDRAGELDKEGRLINVPQRDQGKVLVDVAPARETRK